MKLNPPLRFFGNRGAVAGTFTVVSIAAVLILVTLFLCRRRRRANRQPRARARDRHISQPSMREISFADDPFACANPRDSTTATERQYRWEGNSSFSATDEQAAGYVEIGSLTSGFTAQRNDVGDNILYETKNPRLAGTNPGIVVNYRNQPVDDPFSDNQIYQSKLRPTSSSRSSPINNMSTVAPSKAYLPFPNWRPASQTSSAPSIYPATLPDDNDSDHQPPTPTSITYPKTATGSSQSYNWGASARKPNSYGIPVNFGAYTTPSDSDEEQGSSTGVQQETPSVGYHQYVPPRSPLRAAMSMRTLLNVSSSALPGISTSTEHNLTNLPVVFTGPRE